MGTNEKLDLLINDITEKRKAKFEAARSVYARTHFIASDISACDRYMVYSVLNWQERKAFDGGVMARLEEGSRHEKQMIAELLTMGFSVIQNQMPIEIKDNKGVLMCRGKIDGLLEYQGQKFAMEIKTMNPNVFNSINCLEDFQRKPYLRKYLAQLQLYLYGNNLEYGLFILDNLMGQWKMIPVMLDYEGTEAILQKIERNWKNVINKTYPAPISYDSEMCEDCSFAATCLRDIPASNRLDFSEDKDLPVIVNRFLELKPVVKEYDVLDKAIKSKCELVTENKTIIVGDNAKIEVSFGKRKSYNVPDDVKNQYLEMTDTKKVQVVRLAK